MNRQQRRKAPSKKSGMYRGLKRPTDDGVANGGRKRYGQLVDTLVFIVSASVYYWCLDIKQLVSRQYLF